MDLVAWHDALADLSGEHVMHDLAILQLNGLPEYGHFV